MSNLDKCPNCGGKADQGHSRDLPPEPYFCSKCDPDPRTMSPDNKLEQMQEKLRSHLLMCDMPIDQINPALKVLTEVWNEAIKKCEGCVPEERKGAEYPSGHNSCRNQTLQAISKLKI